MIVSGPLTPVQQRISRRNFNGFNLLNGLSYMCLGETVIILFAVRLGAPDYCISTLGAMMYLGFIMLPLGKVVAARSGAARSQAIFWIFRNVSALLVAVAAPLTLFGGNRAAMFFLVVGAFLFYGCRAAGIAMSQPLIGEVTTPANRAAFIGQNTALFFAANIAALIVISLVLKINSGMWTLTGIILAGSLLGVGSSHFLDRIMESPGIRKSARKPLMREIPLLLGVAKFRKLILAGVLINLAAIMLLPISMLTVKRAYGVSDTEALVFALFQFLGAAFSAYYARKWFSRIPSFRMMVFGYAALVGVALLWIFAPKTLHYWFCAPLFLLGGSAFVLCANSMTHYFLSLVEPHRQVAMSIIVSMITGAGAGVAGMLLAGGLLQGVEALGPAWHGTLAGYRVYFLIVLFLLGPWIFFFRTLTGGKSTSA